VSLRNIRKKTLLPHLTPTSTPLSRKMFFRLCDGIQAHSEPGNLRDRLALENVIKMREGEMTSTNFNNNNHQSKKKNSLAKKGSDSSFSSVSIQSLASNNSINMKDGVKNEGSKKKGKNSSQDDIFGFEW